MVYILVFVFAVGSTPAPVSNVVEMKNTYDTKAACVNAGHLTLKVLNSGTYMCLPKGQ